MTAWLDVVDEEIEHLGKGVGFGHGGSGVDGEPGVGVLAAGDGKMRERNETPFVIQKWLLENILCSSKCPLDILLLAVPLF